ncbi:tetratricopeptide repeat protein [Candidatus Woesebacteria bacterium]|nr:tetratricopeptide repeat protein [Candidatus Woesebacteria bacterium]
MSTQVNLKNLAIKNAKEGNWEEAIKNNEELFALNPENINALNRLGIANIQLKKTAKAKKYFKQVLEIDQNNRIAQKHLDRLNSNKEVAAPSFIKQHFIEEPGKTKTVQLLRLAGKQVLENIPVGKSCELKIKNRFISIESDSHYLGSLPEDLSFRLSKLIKNGNTYSCQIRSCTTKQCCVYLKEISQSEKNEGAHSFPPKDIALSPLSEIDESIILEENIPVELVRTDEDFERTLEDVNTDDILKD